MPHLPRSARLAVRKVRRRLTRLAYAASRTRAISGLGHLNVFIGGNGAGKSNLIQAFRFLREIVMQNLAGYTATKGGADSLLYFGRKASSEMEFYLEFGGGNTSNAYRLKLRGTDEGGLIIWEETSFDHDKVNYPTKPFDNPIAHTVKESGLKHNTHISARQVLADLENYRVYTIL